MSQITPNELLSARTFRALRRGLDYVAARQGITAENIANVDTPGYKARDVDFKAQLDAIVHPRPPLLTATDPGHITGSGHARLTPTSERSIPATGNDPEPQPEPISPLSMRNDENTVDIDREMAKLAETQLAFASFGRLLSARMESIRMVGRDVR